MDKYKITLLYIEALVSIEVKSSSAQFGLFCGGCHNKVTTYRTTQKKYAN